MNEFENVRKDMYVHMVNYIEYIYNSGNHGSNCLETSQPIWILSLRSWNIYVFPSTSASYCYQTILIISLGTDHNIMHPSLCAHNSRTFQGNFFFLFKFSYYFRMCKTVLTLGSTSNETKNICDYRNLYRDHFHNTISNIEGDLLRRRSGVPHTVAGGDSWPASIEDVFTLRISRVSIRSSKPIYYFFLRCAPCSWYGEEIRGKEHSNYSYLTTYSYLLSHNINFIWFIVRASLLVFLSIKLFFKYPTSYYWQK